MGDREKWNDKHAALRQRAPEPPDTFVVGALESIAPPPPGVAGQPPRALDLAAGRGRHALHLARLGFRVEAWDLSPVGLEILTERARAAGLDVACRTIDAADTTDEAHDYDVLVLVDFLDRALFGRLWRLVRPGGHLVLATFTTERPGTHPSDRWCLVPGELDRGMPGFETVVHDESAGRAGLLGRRHEDSPA